MNKTNKILSIVIVVLLIIIGYLVVTKSKTLIGAVSGQLIEDNIPYFRNNGGMNTALPITTSSSVTIGSTGTAIANMTTGTCYIAPYATTIVGSSTVAVDCQGTLGWNTNGTSSATSAITGVGVNDSIVAVLSTTTALIANRQGLGIVGVSASTTAGHIQLLITNYSGATYTWPIVSGTASGTASFVSTR